MPDIASSVSQTLIHLIIITILWDKKWFSLTAYKRRSQFLWRYEAGEGHVANEWQGLEDPSNRIPDCVGLIVMLRSPPQFCILSMFVWMVSIIGKICHFNRLCAPWAADRGPFLWAYVCFSTAFASDSHTSMQQIQGVIKNMVNVYTIKSTALTDIAIGATQNFLPQFKHINLIILATSLSCSGSLLSKMF